MTGSCWAHRTCTSLRLRLKIITSFAQRTKHPSSATAPHRIKFIPMAPCFSSTSHTSTKLPFASGFALHTNGQIIQMCNKYQRVRIHKPTAGMGWLDRAHMMSYIVPTSSMVVAAFGNNAPNDKQARLWRLHI